MPIRNPTALRKQSQPHGSQQSIKDEKKSVPTKILDPSKSEKAEKLNKLGNGLFKYV